MNKEITLDVRGLEPPEPLELVLDALSVLGEDQCLRMLIDREPHPLYRILARNGFTYETQIQPDHNYEILIRHRR
jgi:uncharacterized protein (DUF2249 family)